MNPTPGDVHINRPLSNISIAYLQEAGGFVADKIFPNIPVSNQSDAYFTFDRGSFNRDEMKQRAPATESKGVDYKISQETYYAKVWALHHDIPDQLRANADSQIGLDRQATQLLTNKAMIRREKIWVDTYFKGGVWAGGDVDGVASNPSAGVSVLQWSDANSTPIEDIRLARTNMAETTAGFRPNTLVLGARVVDALLDHPDIIDRVKYNRGGNGPAQVDLSDLQALLKINRIFVIEAVENTAKEGQAAVHNFIGGKKALLCYAAPTPGMMTPSAGYTFSWSGLIGASNDGMRMKKFRLEQIESDRVEIQMAMDQKLIAADLGYFFDSIVA